MTSLSRVDVAERMDAPDADPVRVRESLRDLGFVNRFLGGTAALLPDLRRAIAGLPPGAGLRVLDVGTGAADVPEELSRRAARLGHPVWAVGVDRGRAAIAVAKEAFRQGVSSVRLVRSDARSLPFRDGAFDVVISSTTLHHFSGADAVRVLREMRRVAGVGVVIGDLRRSRPGYWAARALAATLWRRHPYARHDGPVSVRRAYTVAEVRRLLAAAALTGSVRRRPFFRLSVRILCDGPSR